MQGSAMMHAVTMRCQLEMVPFRSPRASESRYRSTPPGSVRARHNNSPKHRTDYLPLRASSFIRLMVAAQARTRPRCAAPLMRYAQALLCSLSCTG